MTYIPLRLQKVGNRLLFSKRKRFVPESFDEITFPSLPLPVPLQLLSYEAFLLRFVSRGCSRAISKDEENR